MPLPGKEGKLLKRLKVRFFPQIQPLSTTSSSQTIRESAFFRTTAKYQVATRTCGVRPTEIQCSRNQISTNSHFNGFESIPIDGDVSKPTAITTTHVQPTDGNASKSTAIATTYVPPTSPITLRITQRTNRIKSYEKPPIRSSNRCNLIHICNTREKLPSSNLPSILMANVRSLLPKVDELDTIAQLNSAQVISITETWLSNAIPDRAVNVPNFILMRKDRSHCNKSIGGGICAYVHHSIPAERLTNFELPGLETLWIHLKPYRLPRHTSTIILGVIYYPPSAKADDNEILTEHINFNVDSLLNKYPDALIVLTGDFNPSSTNISLSNLARGCGLTQLVKVPTRGNNILDWCLVNKPKLFEEPVQLPNIGSSDHFSIMINPSAPNPVIRERHAYKREMKDSNVRAFGRWICNDPWSGVFNEDDCQDKLDTFYELIMDAINLYFPLKKQKISVYDKP